MHYCRTAGTVCTCHTTARGEASEARRTATDSSMDPLHLLCKLTFATKLLTLGGLGLGLTARGRLTELDKATKGPRRARERAIGILAAVRVP